MTTTSLQRAELAQPDRPVAASGGQRRELMEEACLTGLSVFGGLLFLALLLVVVELLYFGLTIQNAMVVLPAAGAS